MNESELVALLHRSESETLDFKRDQYPFAGKTVTDDEKSELLKDILSLTNAWKTSDGYILIGVDEKDGRASQVRGVITMLDDHSVQQFVNSKTNRPVSFRIEVVDHQNVKLSVIHIDKAQKRPIYLAKNFGALKKEVVYIRRGSSTDMAAPDEIAEMGKEAIQESKPEVSIEFELVIEKWQSSFGPRISEQEMDFLKIYAVNNKGGLAQYLQGYVWIPSVVPHDSRYLATTPDGFAQAEQISLEINNKISENPGSMWHPRSKAEWKPLSPGMRICLQEIRIFAYREMLTTSTASIRWQFSVNGSDSIKGETKFADIPLIDRRNRS